MSCKEWRRRSTSNRNPTLHQKELQSGARLACQVKVKQDMDITIPEEVLELKWEATVVSNYNVALL